MTNRNQPRTKPNRLRAYVRRTMLTAARDYAGWNAKRRTAESTKSACMDYTRGTGTGTWSDLIYTRDVARMFNTYRTDVRSAILDFLSETGVPVSNDVRRDDSTTFADMLSVTGSRIVWCDRACDWQLDGSPERADVACLAIRFAVEWYAGEVARELCPDL